MPRSKAAKAAAELAATEFKQTPGQLVGTGGVEWKALFEAARIIPSSGSLVTSGSPWGNMSLPASVPLSIII